MTVIERLKNAACRAAKECDAEVVSFETSGGNAGRGLPRVRVVVSNWQSVAPVRHVIRSHVPSHVLVEVTAHVHARLADSTTRRARICGNKFCGRECDVGRVCWWCETPEGVS